MNGIKIKAGSNEKQTDEKLPFVTLLLLTTGVFGFLLLLRAPRGVDFPLWLVLPPTAALCWAVWYSFSRSRKLFYIILTAVSAACVFAAVLMWSVLIEQISQIQKSLSGDTELTPMTITPLALLTAAVLAIVLFAIECLIKNHLLIYVLTTILLLVSPLLGINANVEMIFLLILFQMAFWTLHAAAGKAPFRSFRSRLGRAGKSGTVVCIIIITVFCAALTLTVIFHDKLYGLAYEAEGFVFRSASELSGKASEPITGGKISRGNTYKTGAEHLRLTASRKPSETLYLRGFGGGEYIGGDWIRSSDEALFEKMLEKPYWQDRPNRIGSLYYSMYYILNENTSEAEPVTLTIRHGNNKYENAYVPYYSQRSYNYLFSSTAAAYEYSGYVYRYFEQKDMKIDWEDIPEDFEDRRDTYKVLQEDYIEQIRTAYTQVPKEQLPRLCALVEENPLSGLDEITAFILYTLHSNAVYSMTPGWSAFNQDIAEYFLFERKRGFCEHFALTATLMYRLYGIPARYATGYMAAPSDFEPMPDGRFQAVMTDEKAHAWAEIFLEDYGWTPVEVTPSSDGSTIASYPGLSSLQLNMLMKDRRWESALPNLGGNGADNTLSAARQGNSDFLINVEIDWIKYRDLFLVLITCLCCLVLAFPLILDHRRLKRLKRLETSGCRVIFHKMMDALRFGGIMSGYDGTEADFAERLSGALPDISQNEAERLVEIVVRAAFGPAGSKPEEDAYVRSLYHRISAAIYGSLSKHKKFIFRYVKTLG